MVKEMTSLDDFYQTRIYEMEMSVAVREHDVAYFGKLNPRLFKDGDQWCCLLGENIQEGVAGFGDTPHKAIMQWNHNLEFEKAGSERDGK